METSESAATPAGIGGVTGIERRRHGYRIAPEFQSRFRSRILAIAALTSGAALLLSWTVGYVARHPEKVPASLWVPLGLIGTALAFGALILYLCDRLSHRYAGPAYRLLRTLEAVRQGQRPPPIRLRHGDEFHDLADALNETLRGLGAMDDSSD